eukprot:COSAG02_NODE_1671_length_11389_cov_24.192826_6_plen_64_part_00
MAHLCVIKPTFERVVQGGDPAIYTVENPGAALVALLRILRWDYRSFGHFCFRTVVTASVSASV